MSSLFQIYIQNPSRPGQRWASSLGMSTCLHDAMSMLKTLDHAMGVAGMMNREKPLFWIANEGAEPITMSPNGRWWICETLPDGRVVPSARAFEAPADMAQPVVGKSCRLLHEMPAWAFAWSMGVRL